MNMCIWKIETKQLKHIDSGWYWSYSIKIDFHSCAAVWLDIILQEGRWWTWWTRGCRLVSPRLRCCRSSATPVMLFLACTSARHPSSTETLRWHPLHICVQYVGWESALPVLTQGKHLLTMLWCAEESWLICLCELKLRLIMESSNVRGQEIVSCQNT